MNSDQQPGPSRQGPAKSPKGRRQAPTTSSSTDSPSPKRPRVVTPPELGSEENPIRIDSIESNDSVVCLDDLARQKSSGSEVDSDIAVVEPLDPGPSNWSETSEEEGWIADRPTVKQAAKQMDHVQEPRSSDDE